MKKILFSFFILGMSFSAFGATFNCQKQKLPGGKAENSNEYLYVSNSDHEQDKAFVCGHLTTSGCDSDHYIYVRGVHYWNGSSVGGAQLYSCDYQKGWGDAWVRTGFDNLDPCESTEGRTFVTTINGNKKVYTTGSYRVHSSSDYVVAKEFCYTDEEKVQPVVVEQTCEQSHCSGVSGDALTKCRACCAGENEITWNGSDCSCKDANKNFDVSTRRCVAKGGNGGNNGQQQQCKDSGGTWNQSIGGCSCDAEKNLVKKGNVCECKSSEYTRSRDGKSCVLTNVAARKRECENTDAKNSGAYWDESAEECKCRDVNKEFVGGQCQTKADITKCNSIVGAEWSVSLSKCVCTDENMEINANETQCVEKKSVKQEREQQAIADKIISAGGVLDSIVAGFGKSKWKNAQGEFNTARLASDSIAAVVLGTAGGLITSSVMKKHQVEDGFEDLKCVIGGQPVAGWGDEFRVGIQ